MAWDLLYGWHFGIKGIVSAVEVIFDIRDSVRLLEADRQIEGGYLIGKGYVHAAYFQYSLVVGYLYYRNNAYVDPYENNEELAEGAEDIAAEEAAKVDAVAEAGNKAAAAAKAKEQS